MAHGAITTGVTFPLGFQAAGMYAGIGKPEGDLALLVSDVPAAAAGVFTRNRLAAAPVRLSRERLAEGRLQAVVMNSGNANAATGLEGEAAARAMAEAAARALDFPEEAVAVASTGVIGVRLPVERIRSALPELVRRLRPEGGSEAARAIMTTDTFPKETGRTVSVPGGEVRIGGMAKGSGMIHPNLATMLGFVTTDANLSPETLQELLAEGVVLSFNQVTVDGDESTNDMVLVLANGRSGTGLLRPGTAGFPEFREAFFAVLRDLSRQIARDGEGATKLITVTVTGARNDEEARRAARTVAGSALVKAAVFGNDANWGRILAALGRAGVELEPAKLRVFLGDILVYAGEPAAYDEAAATDAIRGPEVGIRADLGLGRGWGEAWGCDLSYDYVRINGSYRS